jgi:alpha-mannosidase
VREGKLVVDLGPYQPRSFALKLALPGERLAPLASAPVALTYDRDVLSTNADRKDGSFDEKGRSMPAEMLPAEIAFGGVRYRMGSGGAGAKNAVVCRGQEIELPDGDFDRVRFLAAADEDVRATFAVGGKPEALDVQSWTGAVGRWDLRVWEGGSAPADYKGQGHVVGFEPGYIHRAPIAWFCTHRHDPERGDEAYRFSYLFEHVLEKPAGARTVKLPDDPRIKILAMCVSSEGASALEAAAPLYDDFSDRGPLALRHVYPPPPEPVYAGRTATGKVVAERAKTFAELSIGAPSKTDWADDSSGHGVQFRFFEGDGEYLPHRSSGAVKGTLPRLNDGEVAQNEDDTRRCVWYDNEGRFYADLGKGVPVKSIRTYSWHRSNRAPQRFSLWASNAEPMPDPGFQHGEGKEWTLLGVVDTTALGEGGVHGSLVEPKEGSGSLGTYRYLLWIAEDVGEGTFFTEIDVDAGG